MAAKVAACPELPNVHWWRTTRIKIVEYVDCDTGLPCNSSIMEIIDKSKQNSVIYNINGQAINRREGLYIENGKIYYKK